MYFLLFITLFGGGVKPAVVNIGNGNIGKLNGVCENGSRSHMQMMVNLLKFDKYKVSLLQEWIFGKRKPAETLYQFYVDGKKIKLTGMPVVSGMYLYSPVFVAVYKKEVKWGNVRTGECNGFLNVYKGKGLVLYPTTATGNLKPCNMVTLNNQTVEIAPLFTTSEYHVFLLRAEEEGDSVNVVISSGGVLKEKVRLKSGEVYLGIMDSKKYNLQIDNINLNLPEALELLGR